MIPFLWILAASVIKNGECFLFRNQAAYYWIASYAVLPVFYNHCNYWLLLSIIIFFSGACVDIVNHCQHQRSAVAAWSTAQ